VLAQFMVDGPEFRVEGQDCVVRLGRGGLGFTILGGDLVGWLAVLSSSLPLAT
jgi:hypothetical protein